MATEPHCFLLLLLLLIIKHFMRLLVLKPNSKQGHWGKLGIVEKHVEATQVGQRGGGNAIGPTFGQLVSELVFKDIAMGTLLRVIFELSSHTSKSATAPGET